MIFAWFGLLLPQAALAFVPNDPELGKQDYLERAGAYAAWDIIQGSPEIVVAVLDTGVDLDHPDLAANLWKNLGEIPGDGIDNDGNGYIDDYDGWDFVRGRALPIPESGEDFNADAVNHGTAIAGVIGAVGNNGLGIAGLNWRVKIMPLRILDNFGSGKSDRAREAVRYAVDNGARIINLSFTGFELDASFLAAVREAYEAGVVVVAAVGNQSRGGVNMDERPVYPACFVREDGADLVLGVAALKSDFTKTDFSNYGADCVDLSAPGQGIFSTFYHDPSWPGFNVLYGGGLSGTSLASPMVAGASALLLARFPGLSPAQVKTILQLSVVPVRDPSYAKLLGAGALNIGQALAIASQFVPEMSPRQTSTPSTPSDIFVLAAPAGSSPLVQVYDSDGRLQNEFYAYHPDFKGGVRAALGDVNGDGLPEIITGAGPGGGPHVRVFKLDGSLVSQFFAFDPASRHGIFVAAGDINGDGRHDIAVGADAGGRGEVRVFNLAGENLLSAYPYGQAEFGVRVGLADLDGSGQAEMIVGPGTGRAPEVKVLSAGSRELSGFTAYDPRFESGIFVAGADLNQDGRAEIITGTASGGGSHVRVFKLDGSLVAQFFAYDPSLRRGVKVAAGRLGGQSVILTATSGADPVRVFDLSGALIKEFNQTRIFGPNLALWNP